MLFFVKNGTKKGWFFCRSVFRAVLHESEGASKERSLTLNEEKRSAPGSCAVLTPFPRTVTYLVLYSYATGVYYPTVGH